MEPGGPTSDRQAIQKSVLRQEDKIIKEITPESVL